MKNLFFVLFALLSSFAIASVADVIIEYSFSERVHDFGSIVQDEPVNTIFYLENQGNAPIVIKDIKSPCGCTVASYTVDPISPNERGEIEVRYNAAKEGSFQKDLKVYLQGIKDPEILTIKGEVK